MTKDEQTTTQSKTWVNNLMDKDLVAKLDEMREEDGGISRQKFIQILIKREHDNRQQVKNFLAKMGKEKVINRKEFINEMKRRGIVE